MGDLDRKIAEKPLVPTYDAPIGDLLFTSHLASQQEIEALRAGGRLKSWRPGRLVSILTLEPAPSSDAPILKPDLIGGAPLDDPAAPAVTEPIGRKVKVED